MAKGRGWIKGAIKHPGALRAKAKRAGGLTSNGTISSAYLHKALKSSNPTTRKQASLALTLKKMH